ncbi:MAG TPA: LD-carboxypeptidase [Melioribacteraceae bacterium]|nr:LD-carboxypeptidase [Melioribacteraceae bacterium]
MNRRDLLKSAALSSAFMMLPMNNMFSFNTPNNKIKPIKPKRLNKGDLIGLAAPASFIEEKELNEAITQMEKLGFRTKYNEKILSKYGYLGGTDKERAEDLASLFGDKEIKGIICVRGGYGTPRLSTVLDYNIIKHNPKVLCGYSDITSLIYSIYSQTGLIGFHGPVATSTYNDFSLNYFIKTLIEPQKTLVLNSAQDENPEDTDFNRYTINDGICEGIIAGGNLSLVVTHIGTKYDIDLKGKILFLEEINEEPYRIDRMLTQMINAGKFEGISGIALGVFKGCEKKKRDASFEDSLTLKEVLIDRLKSLNVPTIYGLSFGHIKNKFTLPIGIKAKLDTFNNTLTLLEPAVL